LRLLAVAYASAIFACVHICRIYAAKALFPNRKEEKTFVVSLRSNRDLQGNFIETVQ